jgi:exodeoxyribonuclease V gamma subunit
VEVEQLVRFVEHPVREFLRARLDVRVRDFHDEVDDALAVELDGLGLWRVGDRMLKACMSGAGIDAAVDAEIARGTLPPGKLAEPVVKRVRPIVEQIISAADAELGRDREPGSVDVKVALRDGRSLSGTVPDVSGHVVAPINFSRLGANHRLATWVRLLALTAADPERPFEALTIGRAPSGGGPARVSVARIPPLGATPAERRDTAHAHLDVLLDLFDRGMREPLPIACKSSAAYAQAAAGGGDPVKAGTAAWESGWKVPGEDRDEEHELVLGEVLSFGELLAESPRADESGDGWDASDQTRFGRYARRLWSGLLAHEQVDQR